MQKKPNLIWIPYLCILVFFVLSLILIYRIPTRQELSIELQYGSADEDILAQLFWGENGALSADRCSDGYRTGSVVFFDLPQAPSGFRMLRIDPSNTDSVYSITRVIFRLNEEEFYSMGAEKIMADFTPVNADVSLSGEELTVIPHNTDSGLLIDSQDLNRRAVEASDALRTLQIRQRFFLLLFLTVFLILTVHFAKPLKNWLISLFSRDKNGRFDFLTLFAVAVMAGAMLVVIVIGLFSELGLHPDEWDVKKCLDYGMTHFLPPDMRDPEVASTYSGYGYTKLINYTWYFFLAGKIALPFQKMFYSIQYYRIPNILLFAALAIFLVRNIKKRPWLMIAFGICVQAWYIFCYTTADALDFLLSLLIIYELATENSLLYRTVSARKITRRNLPAFLLLGILFGMIALGKPNYLAVLALAFFVLLYKLIREKDKGNRKNLWRNYWLIIAVFLIVFLTRASFDLIHYGFDKAAVKEEMSLIYSDPDKNPATPIEEQCPSYHMMSKGASLADVFRENPKWFSMSYQSFCGICAPSDTNIWYYIFMGIFYAALFLGIGIVTFRQKDNYWGRVEFITGTVLMLCGLGASVINSYVIDSQAQGRYLLPMILIAGYLASRTPQLFEKWYYRALLIAAGVLSVAYFGLVGVPMFL